MNKFWKIHVLLNANVYHKKNPFSVDQNMDSFSSNEFIDENLFTNDNVHFQKRKASLNAHVKSISSNSLTEDVESINEDVDENEDIYLLKSDVSSKDFFERMRSKDRENCSETIRFNVDLELQSSNKLIQGIRSADLKSLKHDYQRRSQNAWSSQFALLLKSNLQLSLNRQVIDFWQQKNQADQDEESKIIKKRKYLKGKNRSFKSINLSQAKIRRQNLMNENSDDEWEIKKIINMRKTKKEREYKVVWISIWVNEKDLNNVTNLISDFRDGKRVKFST